MDRKPLEDPFGDYFEEFLSNSSNGQFFTPSPVAELMAQLTVRQVGEKRKDGDTRVCDSCCGSGRLLLAAAQQDRKQFLLEQTFHIPVV